MRRVLILCAWPSACSPCWPPRPWPARRPSTSIPAAATTRAIQAAFNAAVKAGPGSTVQLSAGHFYTNTIFVQNFNGTFKGAGQGKTFIDAAGRRARWARSRSTTPATRSRPGHRCTASWAAACVSPA